ncbi:hypothetical protein OUZ56_029876 [Daphnia magna]|uniref:Transposable element P transposase-like GTP-binding insertion domain-containing protein n=1 Tax=Daphnia magna TaxID=35525 RepID=A0ABR0B853_9CRUS|nr:hypothetical protein OUZ56_029876 [Daphnia magna]
MFYQRVFEHQRLLGLKLVPKLKLAHIWPSTWQRMTVSLATQLYSKHMAMALKFLREDRKTAHLFNGSEATEKLTKLINDTFDIMNGRHKGESINGNNWNNLVEMEGKVTKGKKSVLEDMLKIIELTEECHRNPGKRPIMAAFASDTTLDGWRLSIRSTIDLTEELLNPKNPLEKYDFVLTAKWNQDALEMTFGRIRSVDTHPTAASFLHIIRMMSLYTPAKILLRNANVENDDHIRVLVDFKECLIKKFPDNAKAATDLRVAMKDDLMEELGKRYVNELPLSKEDRIGNFLIYDVAGYMVKTRENLFECEACRQTVITKEADLPSDFDADAYTRARTKGGLVFVTLSMYQTLCAIEKVVSNHFKSLNHIYITDTFQECIAKVKLTNVLPLFVILIAIVIWEL